MRGLIEQLRDEDPSFDPLIGALAEADVSREIFNAAMDRVITDGYYGPINDDEWREQDGREPSSVSEALKILSRVSDEINDYRVEVTYECANAEDICGEEYADCPGHAERETAAEAEDIRRDLFRELVRIHGHLPF